MSFGRIARILYHTARKAASHGAMGLAAGAVGGSVLKATNAVPEENILDCLVMGVLIGGINGAIDGFLEQLAIEMGPEIDTGISMNGHALVGHIPEPHIAQLHKLSDLATFGTPALVWFIQTQANDTNLNIGLTFGTYWTGIGVIGAGFAALLSVSCCCCLPPAALLALFMKEFVSSNFGDQIAATIESMHDRFFDGGGNDRAPVSNSRVSMPFPGIAMSAPDFPATSTHVISIGGMGDMGGAFPSSAMGGRSMMMFSSNAGGGFDMDRIGRQHDAIISQAMGQMGMNRGPGGFNF